MTSKIESRYQCRRCNNTADQPFSVCPRCAFAGPAKRISNARRQQFPSNKRISFAEAAAHLSGLKRCRSYLNGFGTISERHSSEFAHPKYGAHIWNLQSDDDEAIAF